MRIIRLPEVIDRLGERKSAIYKKINDGSLPKPVRISANASGWGDHEIEAINRARLAGKSEEEIRALVAELHAAREHALAEYFQQRANESAERLGK